MELAASVGGQPIRLNQLEDKDELQRLAISAGAELGKLQPVLMNSTSVGMQPYDGETPVPQVR